MSRISSWVGKNMTTWFQTKRNQQNAANKQKNDHHEHPNDPADPLSRSILDIMHRPKEPPTKPKP